MRRKKLENFEQMLLKVNMKIIHEKNIKGYIRKENGKWKTFIVKEKNSWVSKCTKDIVQLQVQFVSILPCLNVTIISSGLI